VALSQHGTVAPVTLHHRVDFAASMVDGRTVGEVVGKSTSAKEVADLWIYVQDRLSRLMQDPDFVPAKPANMAVNSLTPLDGVAAAEEDSAELEIVSDEPPPLVITQDYQGPDRRVGEDRRDENRPQHYGPSDKRTLHPFGRRVTDRAPAFGRAGQPNNGLYK
jgi:chromosome partitioning protein